MSHMSSDASSGAAGVAALYVHDKAPVEPSAALKQRYEQLPEYQRNADGTPDYLKMILGAHLYDLVKQTPLQPATRLGTRMGCEMLVKREDLQPVFSFKLRGAYNMMRQLDDDKKWKGVIACSAGNHAQGVALSGAHLSVPCIIVMPRGTPSIKWENVERLGARVVFHGNDFDEAKAECARLAEAHNLVLVPPFDDPLVIAGQGTIAQEICSQTDISKVDAVFCPVGGGGLLAGVAAYIKSVAPPHVKVIGVDTFDADALTQSLERHERFTIGDVGLFSDGTAVRLVGEECYRVAHELVDAMVRVSNDEICAAIKDMFEDTRAVSEPAGALAVAGMKRYVSEIGESAQGKRYVAILSGANTNFSRLRYVAERADLGEQKEVLLSVEIPECPGSFLTLYNEIYPRDVSEFVYRYSNGKTAHVYAAMILNGTVPDGPAPPGKSLRQREVDGVMDGLRAKGFDVIDMSNDELAKAHGRYLVGGRENVEHERLIRFEFPERPGALRRFLLGIDAGWNISLFHYRNHGGEIGRVLAGIQVPPETEDRFKKFLHELGYSYYEETDSPVVRRYLRAD
ncbi:threonine ammonia-lyase [Malassezia cuniculi]|uniref:Threonine dehydratase n=1 Tax=Malassezia cuniculi TaxID=948313 RepID=A0AAF0ETN3_9BASI|nr:threonine ammonia-lyase [Malassezia cuniculi]